MLSTQDLHAIRRIEATLAYLAFLAIILFFCIAISIHEDPQDIPAGPAPREAPIDDQPAD